MKYVLYVTREPLCVIWFPQTSSLVYVYPIGAPIFEGDFVLKLLSSCVLHFPRSLEDVDIANRKGPDHTQRQHIPECQLNMVLLLI